MVAAAAAFALKLIAQHVLPASSKASSKASKVSG
jgi:hypothetical protein